MKKEKINSTLYEYEQKYWNKNLSICGIDEVGRGCLAGPVVTSAVILHPQSYHPLLKDSKLLKQNTMLEVYNWLIKHCTYTIAINSPRIIDQINIYKATQLTMKNALINLCATTPILPAIILTDAMPLQLTNTPYESIPRESLIKGELKSASIAAASIIAKVTRDSILQRMHNYFPLYNLKQHKGYATSFHREKLTKNGSSIIHRQTFLKNLKTTNGDIYEQTCIFS